MLNRYRKLRVKDLPKGPYVAERVGFEDLNLRPSGWKTSNTRIFYANNFISYKI